MRAPPHLKGWRKAWWWFDFIFLVKLARRRFVAVLVAIGAGITQLDTLVAHDEKLTRPAGDAAHVAGDVEWFCPMHPSVVRDNGKDKCPVCFMPLSKRKKGNASDETLPAGVVSRVQLSPYRVVLALAKLSPEDRKLAASQKFCPILTESRLGSMGTPHKILIEGQLVFLCCAGCMEDALKDPQATLAKVEKLKQTAKTGAVAR